MKWRAFSFVVITLVGTAGCSRLRSPETSSSAQSRPEAGTPAKSRDLAKEDLDKLQGTWRIESSFWNGVREADIARSVTIIFQGDKFIVVDRDGKRQEETIKLAPDQNPKAIDCSSKSDGQPSPGIYLLEGDKLTWCGAGGDKKVRPTSFDSKPGSKISLMVLRREKG
jgi:uncharacterized protein (TIGR03067 family)